ncbi:RAMP superfamily CRISPR-associated protein [Persicobacter psychrovividus]|uniref:CRISPR type III-associated protein domain-containing protein n=1 Tax=Persicobacter psychrovividus TaxID=387638 RepID=A0ABM7VM28_9BACT|nr:hypothetical protein PEPS_43410 [Persicobacter psychrovividus]
MSYPIKYIARLDIETTSPLKIGTGQQDWISDQPIYRDAFGMPAIPGTSLTGILRSRLTELAGEEKANQLFGHQGLGNDEGEGSRVILSNASLIGVDNRIMQTAQEYMKNREEIEQVVSMSFIRERVRISDKGSAVDKGKFDEEVLPAGARFRFEICLQGMAEENSDWQSLLNAFYADSFLVGGNTRSGKGQFKVIDAQTASYDLSKADDLQAWANYPMDLNQKVDALKPFEPTTESDPNWEQINLSLKAKDFFSMGAGFGKMYSSHEIRTEDDKPFKVDSIYKKEAKFHYAQGKIDLEQKESVLIPGTSIKGALRHRAAYHYNKLAGCFANQLDQEQLQAALQEEFARKKQQYMDELIELIRKEAQVAENRSGMKSTEYPSKVNEIRRVAKDEKVEQLLAYKKEQIEKWLAHEKGKLERKGTEENNAGISELFGFSRDLSPDEKERQRAGEDVKDKRKGTVVIPDVFIDAAQVKEQLFNHVKIDRFRGGAFNGALFNEMVAATEAEIPLKIQWNTTKIEDENAKEALRLAIEDLKAGRLPLGGRVNHGHGVFLATKAN